MKTLIKSTVQPLIFATAVFACTLALYQIMSQFVDSLVATSMGMF